MTVTLDAGKHNRFPEVIAVDADKRSDTVHLMFNTRIEGQGTGLRITLTSGQWANLKFLVDHPTEAGTVGLQKGPSLKLKKDQ